MWQFLFSIPIRIYSSINPAASKPLFFLVPRFETFFKVPKKPRVYQENPKEVDYSHGRIKLYILKKYFEIYISGLWGESCPCNFMPTKAESSTPTNRTFRTSTKSSRKILMIDGWHYRGKWKCRAINLLSLLSIFSPIRKNFRFEFLANL